ncbi:hypothetical protein VNI00_006233 [Paramarasmius palmivorus]|uniref:F-box domain-containing protein n=1 Tax=Paramarasmius palmivorus TaxID=297713 RepID=A0AAW0D9A5_9AGAR
MSLILPPEIIILVAERLADDFPSLKSASLVCSTWLKPTRQHLFHSMWVTRLALPQLLALSSHPLSSFPHSVKSLHLDALNSLGHDSALSLGQNLMQLAQLMDSIVSFQLCNANLLDVENLTDDILENIASFRSISELGLDGVSFTSVTQAMRLICAFPRVEKISVRDLVWDDPSGEGKQSGTGFHIPSSLVELQLERCYKRDVMDCLLLQHPFPIVPRLDVGIVSPEDSWAIGQYVERLGSHLVELALGFHSLDAGGDAEDFYHACDLSLCTGLRSIYFKRFVSFWEYRLTSAVPWIIKILSRISTPVFEEISFGIHISHIDQLDPLDLPEDFDWEALDRSLSEISLPNFRTATFIIFIYSSRNGDVYISDSTHVVNLIERYLPRSHERRVLNFKIYRGNWM